ncbi:hypothetical protein PtA15_17A92 [Puccinia triticina]|uniref:Uncharacterized protein n=1 Tax=Puccinia triticina TaxID=208348 RepID=A0ABY7D5F8_9BASI|nr:uncharacterized protein PtA15_17A92 [Puccinia triticina]WAQ92611.1 hypothetical protein PtA15_17A92 [Puccinia triticina]WAR63489.1 hypothetical protein PtB15_17B89 [Puccinia triticina]
MYMTVVEAVRRNPTKYQIKIERRNGIVMIPEDSKEKYVNNAEMRPEELIKSKSDVTHQNPSQI